MTTNLFLILGIVLIAVIVTVIILKRRKPYEPWLTKGGVRRCGGSIDDDEIEEKEGKKLIGLISTEGKTPEEISDEAWKAFEKYQKVKKETEKIDPNEPKK